MWTQPWQEQSLKNGHTVWGRCEEGAEKLKTLFSGRSDEHRREKTPLCRFWDSFFFFYILY